MTFDGFAFWILLPIPSAFFGTSIGRLFRKFEISRAASITTLTLIFVGAIFWMIEFFTLPQVYFFNHVWGMWPGPIYDESLTISGSLIFFRTITILWTLLLWIMPDWSKTPQNKTLFTFTLISLMFCYLNLDEAGLITPRDVLKERLSINIQTEHFDLYFDPNNFSQEEAEFWALRHEFYFDKIVRELEIDWPEQTTIESYIYANAWQKKKLVGAKFTSYVPIWLEQDQLHIAKQQLDGVLQHELVHVISKQFGNWLYNGSSSIGLIEGIAEAIAKDASSESTLDQIIAAEQEFPDAEQMKNALSFSGFYSSAAAISYTTAGSFIEHLIQNYPVEYFKKAYPDGDFDSAYPVSFDVLVDEWQDHLDTTAVDSVDRNISEFIFSRRSLFDKTCPHSFNREFGLWDEYNRHQSVNDSTAAFQTIDELYALNPTNKLVKRDWLRQQLLHGKYRKAISSFDESDSLLTLEILKADALFLNMDFDKARSFIDSLKPEIESSKARNFKFSYELRTDSLNWHNFLSARYNDELPTPDQYDALNTPAQMLLISKAIELNADNNLITDYARIITQSKLNAHWFDIYEGLIIHLVYNHEFQVSKSLIDEIEQLALRARYSERLNELKAWYNFVLSDFK